MAGDWIKMRIDLQSHPKIVRILSATGTDKFRVIGGLHAVWAIFDTHSEDGILQGYTPKALDHVIGWDGFAERMMDVGWLEELTEGLVMPGFEDHNGKSAKRRAEDQKRKREARNSPQSVRNTSANDSDDSGTREEKRREDITTSLRSVDKPASKRTNWVSELVAIGVDEQHAKDWLAVRKQKKAAMTQTALKLLVTEAAKANITVAGAVEIAAARGWQSLKAEWLEKDRGQTNTGAAGASRLSAVDQVRAANDAAEARRRETGSGSAVTGHLQDCPPDYDALNGEFTRL